MDERRTLWIHLTAGGVALAGVALLVLFVSHKNALAWTFVAAVLVVTIYSLGRDVARLIGDRPGGSSA